jgi:hypothetical protein
MVGVRLHTRVRWLTSETKPVKDARCIRADLDAGADLAQISGLLKDIYVQTSSVQREDSGDPSNSPANDGN